jgi:cation diffusion facilitator CzcD-associated flavoprotein CzcO
VTVEQRRFRVAIIGAGFSGLGMAIRLKQQGMDDFVVLERGGEVGGTWRDNTYPGAACDVPSRLYSFSFARNPEWSRSFSPQAEILDYLRRCADSFGVRPHIRLNHTVSESWWDEDAGVWHVETDRGTFTSQVLVSAVGGLSEPLIPEIPGLGSFTGTIFHSATWDHGYDLNDKRVAVVGTGASAIQFVPRIQPKVARLHLFQRTPPWVMRQLDRRFAGAERGLFRRMPVLDKLARAAIYWTHESYVVGFSKPSLLRAASRLARLHLRRQVRDPELRAMLTPDYTMGCKRVLLSNDYYPSLTKPNVELIAAGVREITPTSVIGTDGSERDVDAIIFGTGFHVTDMPGAQHLRGRGGHVLADVWRSNGAAAYLGTTIRGFPNLFVLVGPNTGLGHNSLVFMIESQINYVLDALRRMAADDVTAIEVRDDVVASFNDDVQRRLEGAVWTSGGCKSWYLDEHGRNVTMWPGSTWRFRRATRRFDPAAYHVYPAWTGSTAEPAASVAAGGD